MNKLIEEINNYKVLKSDFLEQLKTHLDKKEKEILQNGKKNISQKYLRKLRKSDM